MDPLAERLVRAIAERDEAAVDACFAPDVRFRALTPSGLRERSGATDTASLIAAWFGDSTEIDVLDAGSDEVADRLRVSYRLAGVEEDEPYVVEQHLFCAVGEGRIMSADLVCSGFRPHGAR